MQMIRLLREVASGRAARAITFRVAEKLRAASDGPCDLKVHALAAIDWILRAQQATPDDGVAESYQVLTNRWQPSYPETTGYIVPTLLRAARFGVGDAETLRAAAQRMGAWLVDQQLDSGAFYGGNVAIRVKRPAVFNTGQILKGLTDLIRDELDDDGRCRASAARAANWLVENQDDDGAWRKGISVLTTEPIHAYNVRTAWALGRYGRTIGDQRAIESAIRNADWLCRLQHADGWFPHMNFDVGQAPLLHTIAYTIRGLIETGALFDRGDFVEAGRRAAARVIGLQNRETGAFPGQISESFLAPADWTNLTGNAQMAIICFRLAAITGDDNWTGAGVLANHFNCSLQDMNHANPGRNGALRGSYPGHKGYGRYWYMNWTQKFHVDALLAQMGYTVV